MKKLQAESKAYYIALMSLVLGTIIILLVTHLEFKPTFHFETFNLYWNLIPLSVGILGLALPNIMVHLLRGIQFIQHKIGLLLTFILLSSVFYLMLTPLALLSRLFSKKKTINENTNFIDRNYTFKKNDFKKTF